MRLPAPSKAELTLLDPDGSFRLRLADDRTRLIKLAVPNPTEDQRAELHRLVHRLAGAAGTFGFAEIGALAITLDDALADGKGQGDAKPMIDALIAALAAV